MNQNETFATKQSGKNFDYNTLRRGEQDHHLPEENLIRYFAYGSCMCEKDFARTVPEYQVMGMAKLADHRVAFTRYEDCRKGGVADVIDAPGEVAEGVLYLFPRYLLKLLDRREGVPERIYERVLVEVDHDGMIVPAWTYKVVEKQAEEIPPSQEYRDIIMTGAEPILSQEYALALAAKMDGLMGRKKST